MMAGPPAAWMAPSTPPPPISELLAALPMASAGMRVMSPSTSPRRRVPDDDHVALLDPSWRSILDRLLARCLDARTHLRYRVMK